MMYWEFGAFHHEEERGKNNVVKLLLREEEWLHSWDTIRIFFYRLLKLQFDNFHYLV